MDSLSMNGENWEKVPQSSILWLSDCDVFVPPFGWVGHGEMLRRINEQAVNWSLRAIQHGIERIKKNSDYFSEKMDDIYSNNFSSLALWTSDRRQFCCSIAWLVFWQKLRKTGESSGFSSFYKKKPELSDDLEWFNNCIEETPNSSAQGH